MEDISKNVPIPNFNSSSEIFKGKDHVIWEGVPSILDDVWEGWVIKLDGFQVEGVIVSVRGGGQGINEDGVVIR